MSEAVQESEYTRIVTNHEEMAELTDLIRLRGVGTDGSTTTLVSDAILNFEDNSIEVKCFDPMASVWVHLRGSFGDVRQDGKLVIGDIAEFRSYLDRFGEHTIIDMGEDEGSFFINFDDEDRKNGGYPATDETHINSAKNVEELPYEYDADEMDYPRADAAGIELDTYFKCDVADIQEILDDGDTTEVREYPITVEDGSVQVRVGNDSGWIDTNFAAIAGDGVASSVYGYGMDNVWSNLSGEVDVFMTEDGPMWIHVDNDEVDYTIDYMIAEDEME